MIFLRLFGNSLSTSEITGHETSERERERGGITIMFTESVVLRKKVVVAYFRVLISRLVSLG